MSVCLVTMDLDGGSRYRSFEQNPRADTPYLRGAITAGEEYGWAHEH